MIRLKIFFLKRDIKKKLKKIKLIVSDVDGVLTNGQIMYGKDISGLKSFNVKDGLAVKLLKEIGINLALISGGESEATLARSTSLLIEECHTNIENKSKTLKEIQTRLAISSENTLYIGDDINDLDVLSKVAIFVVPKDGHFRVRRNAHIKLSKKGGEGVLREIFDILMIFKTK